MATAVAATPLSEEAKKRAKAAVLGAVVADAATMGLHWIYDQAVLKSLMEERGRTEANPEFAPPANKFYTHPDGSLSPYGNELLALLQFLAEKQPGGGAPVDGAGLAKYLASAFKAQAADNRYLNKASKYVVAAVDEGKAWPETGHPEDAQANAFVKAAALVALLGGRVDFTTNVEAAVRAHQNNDKAAAAGVAAALILERVVVQGSSVREAVQWALQPGSGVEASVQESIKAGLETGAGAPFTETVAKLGPSCGLPASLQNALVGCLLQAAPGKTPFAQAVRANIVAGGDNASRASLLGALLAAEQGLEAVPQDWRGKTAQYAEVEKLADALLAKRSA